VIGALAPITEHPLKYCGADYLAAEKLVECANPGDLSQAKK